MNATVGFVFAQNRIVFKCFGRKRYPDFCFSTNVLLLLAEHTSGTLPLHAYSSQGEQPLLGGDWDLSLLHCVRKHVFFLLSGSQKPHRARAVYGTEAVGVAVARRKTSAMDLESRQPLKGSERE